jgi:MFS family permease
MRSLWPRSGLWRHADFLRFWSAQTISQFGSEISLLALPFVAIKVLHASAFEVALLGTLEYLPFILFALPAGVWVDRLPRRPVMMVADLGRAAALTSIPIAQALGGLTIWQLYAAAFVTGTLTVFFDVAYQAYLPSLVGREHLVDGNSKLEATRSAAHLAGPGAAGLLIAAVTAPYAVVADALSFVGSAAFLGRIRRTEEHVQAAAGPRPGMLSEVREGLRYLVRDRYFRAIATCTAYTNFFTSLGFAVFLVYVVRRLGLGAEEVGLVFSVSNVGFLLAALTAGRVAARIGTGPTIIAAAATIGPALLLVPLAPASHPVPFLLVGLAVSAYAGVTYNITALSYLQATTPNRLLGRMNATRRFIVWGTIPLGSLLGGVIASQLGLRTAIFVGAIGATVAFVPVLLSPVRSLKVVVPLVEPGAPADDELRLQLDTQVADA